MTTIDMGNGPMTMQCLTQILVSLDTDGEVTVKGVQPGTADILRFGMMLMAQYDAYVKAAPPMPSAVHRRFWSR